MAQPIFFNPDTGECLIDLDRTDSREVTIEPSTA